MAARGITRAILDTFPVVKFGGNSNDDNGSQRADKDVESPTREMEMSRWEVIEYPNMDDQRQASRLSQSSGDDQQHTSSPLPLTSDPSASSPQPRAPTSRHYSSDDVVPAAIGRETCPICIVDFEEGDDLRLLPCEGNHRFHQTCVDPWLLELSSSCPICRQGSV
jgi:hypothetical protein